MKILKFMFLFALCSSLSRQTLALEYGCKITPYEAVSLSDRIIKSFYQQGGESSRPIPNTLPINSEIEMEMNNKTQQTTDRAQFEVILRPKETAYFNLMNLALFQLERSRHLMYVCLNHDSRKPKESHLTIYFILAYGLEPNTVTRDNLSTIPGDWLFGPAGVLRSNTDEVAELTRLPIEILPLHYATHGVNDLAAYIPLLGKLLKIPGTPLQLSGVLLARLGEALGAGVERIVITPEEIEFANNVDLNHPEKAHVLYKVNLAELKKTAL